MSETTSTKYWMVRAGKAGELVDRFLATNMVAFGRPEIGPLPADVDKSLLLKLYSRAVPRVGEHTRAAWASQLLRFIRDIHVGDVIVTSDARRRSYYFGEVLSEYHWLPATFPERPHCRSVAWTWVACWANFDKAAMNKLRAIQALFAVPDMCRLELIAHRQPWAQSPQPPR